jgi:hypothetical protein
MRQTPKPGPRFIIVLLSNNLPRKCWTSYIVLAPMSVSSLKRATVRPYIVWPAESVGPTSFAIRLLMTPCIDLSFILSAISVLPCKLRITRTRHVYTSRQSMEKAPRFCVRCSTLTQSTRCPRCEIHGGTSFVFFSDGMTDADFRDIDSRPWRSPSRNSVPCSVISMRNGVRRRPPLTLPFGPCIIPAQI